MNVASNNKNAEEEEEDKNEKVEDIKETHIPESLYRAFSAPPEEAFSNLGFGSNQKEEFLNSEEYKKYYDALKNPRLPKPTKPIPRIINPYGFPVNASNKSSLQKFHKQRTRN